LVNSKLANIALTSGQSVSSRAKSEYVGGEVRTLTEDHHVDIALAF